MGSVLIVSSSSPVSLQIQELMMSERYNDIYTAVNGSSARRMCRDREFDIIAVNLPLSDEAGYDLAKYLSASAGAGILLVVSEEMEEAAQYYTAESGALVLPRPICIPLFIKAVHFLESVRCRMKGISAENFKLQKKIEEIRIINRAKYILMEYLSMTEQQAHRYLEKQAMDLRITKTMVAENLLSTYDS